MDARRLQDRIARGLGQAGRRIGEAYDVYRPRDAMAPLDADSRIIRLPMAIHGEDKDWHRSAHYGQPLWFSVHDTGYTRPGDYLVGPSGTFFIAAQPPLLATVCVLTNRLLTCRRTSGATGAGVNAYGGAEPRSDRVLLSNWPASVLTLSGGARAGGALPGEPGPATWSILLPHLPEAVGVTLKADDLLSDEDGEIMVITAAERSTLGWRLLAAQAVT